MHKKELLRTENQNWKNSVGVWNCVEMKVKRYISHDIGKFRTNSTIINKVVLNFFQLKQI